MEMQALFPRWRGASTSRHIDWHRDIDLADDNAFFILLGAIVEDQASSSRERPNEFSSICNTVLLDLLALQAALPAHCNALNLQYLQFEATITPLRMALNLGDFGLSHDWLINGCSAELSHAVERPFYHGRLADFMASEIAWIADNRGNSITEWCFSLFYYSRTRAALFDLAIIALPAAFQAIDESGTNERTVECQCMILNWLVVYDHPAARPLALGLEILFEMPGIPLPSQVRIAVLFATVAVEITNRRPREWAIWALRHGGYALGSHEPLQLLWAQIDTVEEFDHLRIEVFAAAAYYSLSLQRLGFPTAIIQATDQRSAILNPAVVRLARFERGAHLLEMLAEWYGAPRDRRFKGRALFVLPGYEGGFAYLSDILTIVPATGAQQLAELVAVTNEALGLNITLRGDRALPNAPERGGQPAYELGARFEAALLNSYRFDALDAEVLPSSRAIISFPGYPHPVQALLAACNCTILPISSSLREPEADRPIRRVLLWASDNDYYSGFEIDAVQTIFERAGIACDRRSGIGSRPEDFMSAYAEPEYDVIWVAGHGEIDRWRDGSARLIAGDDCIIGIDALVARTPRVSGRRLVVLNICDGGVSAINGGIHRLGLAPMLAGSAQATISHLWPVRPPVAAAFGALLADALMRCPDHLAAFSDTLSRMHSPSGEVTEAVRQLVPEQELVHRLENADLETTNIFNWGSGIFFQ